jgi:hypothetical protein
MDVPALWPMTLRELERLAEVSDDNYKKVGSTNDQGLMKVRLVA